MSYTRELSRAGLLGAALLSLAACKKKPDQAVPGAASASASASAFKPAAPVASGLPGASELVSKVVNPQNEAAYSGPTGAVSGVVTGTGDLLPIAATHLVRIKGACPEGRELYGHVFREGMMRSLADVLVAVTGYSGYVPAKEATQTVAARGCGYNTRTIAITYGETLQVVSKDSEGYAPNLLGSHMKAQLLALPGGAPSKLYPPEPGHYVLTDDLKVFMLADVFVLKYSTHDVTSLDGRYEIKGLPVGKARISALLPATQGLVEKDIEIKAGETLNLPLQIAFDAKAYAAAAAAGEAANAAEAASAAGTAPPAPSASHAPRPKH